MESEKTSILIIDDDEDILSLWSNLLSNNGYMTDTAKTGSEAIEKFREKTFNLALIDIVLPDMQGIQLLARLKDTAHNTRKIIITGHASVDNAIAALNLEADIFIEKPVRSSELLKVIEDQLQKQREEKTMTWKKIADFLEASDSDFREVIVKSLDAFWGKSTTLATIHHIGGEEALRDPKVFAERLRIMFRDEGADIILKYLLAHLENQAASR